MTAARSVVLCAPVRTAIGTFGGSLKETAAPDLGAVALKAAVARAGLRPIGATGAVLTTRLVHSMRRDGLKRGVVTLCIGGGQGIALALETIA